MKNSEITSERIAQDMNRAVYVERCCRSLGISVSEFLTAESDSDRVPDFIQNTPAAKASAPLAELDRSQSAS